MKIFNQLMLAATLTIVTTTTSFAATEIDESDFGPTYGSMVTDAAVGKPLQALNVAFGAASWLVSLPFTLFTGDTVAARQKLIDEPFYALDRCLGCTPAEDHAYKAQRDNSHQMRVVVDGPSEILINTDQNVLIKAP